MITNADVEQLSQGSWRKRMQLFISAELFLNKVERWCSISFAILVFCTLMLAILFFFEHQVSPEALIMLLLFEVMSFMGFCIFYACVKAAMKHKNHLSKLCYMTNHELVFVNNELRLINRGNYKTVMSVVIY